MATIHPRRAGMTLVELLVVVAIIGLLAVTVLPNVATTTENRRSREAARVASSFFAKAQSRAIGRPEWAGVAVIPTNANVLYSIDLFQANVPQVYRGESYESKAFIAGANELSRDLGFYDDPLSKALVTIPESRKVATGDLIRFGGNGPWYEFVKGSPYSVRFRGSLGGSASANEMVGQTARNTPWPAQSMSSSSPQDVAHGFEILRQPVRNGSAFTIPDGRCVDLAWSGYGSSTYIRFVTAGTPVTVPAVTVLFDATGRVRQIFTQDASGSNRVTVTGPVYFLVGRVDRAGNDPTLASTYDGTDDTKGFNWQYGDSYWIVIDPASGIVKTAECAKREDLNGNGTIDPGEDVNRNGLLDDVVNTPDVVVSQAFARSESPVGGR
jgi:prepilin-type N-terminal cleavage/methylation domain-containing protein